MADAIKTSISITLGDGTEATNAVAEVDTRPSEEGGKNALNLGKTSGFEPGDEIWILLYLPVNLEFDYAQFTMSEIEGTAFSNSTGSSGVKLTEQLKFDGFTRSANLGKPNNSGFSVVRWFGNNLERHFQGELIVGESGVVLLPELPEKMKIKTDDSDVQKQVARKNQQLPGICEVTYNATANEHKFTAPSLKKLELFGEPPYPVDIHIFLKKIVT